MQERSLACLLEFLVCAPQELRTHMIGRLLAQLMPTRIAQQGSERLRFSEGPVRLVSVDCVQSAWQATPPVFHLQEGHTHRRRSQSAFQGNDRLASSNVGFARRQTTSHCRAAQEHAFHCRKVVTKNPKMFYARGLRRTVTRSSGCHSCLSSGPCDTQPAAQFWGIESLQVTLPCGFASCNLTSHVSCKGAYSEHLAR